MAARQRGDQIFGTAAPARRWLLVEHPGPWPRRAFETSPVLKQVAARAQAGGVRAVLVRRSGRHPSDGPRAWAYVDSRPGREGVWWSSYEAETDLLEVDYAPTDRRSTEPVYLVCAHGKHDTCCAVEGRPVAASLATGPGTTWECSHIGGDRFAPNVILLPHGFYYGALDPGSALRVAEAYRAGDVVPEFLRGRSCFSPVVQAAQHYARLHTGALGVNALPPLGVEQLDERVTRVRLASGDQALTATVRFDWSVPALLTCAAGRPEVARQFALVELA
jgi:hypothetical protein